MAEALGEVRESLQRNLDAKKGGAEKQLTRLADCIDGNWTWSWTRTGDDPAAHRGRSRKVRATLDPSAKTSASASVRL